MTFSLGHADIHKRNNDDATLVLLDTIVAAKVVEIEHCTFDRLLVRDDNNKNHNPFFLHLLPSFANNTNKCRRCASTRLYYTYITNRLTHMHSLVEHFGGRWWEAINIVCVCAR